MPILLGAIADDFTGATDLCSMLVRNGMRTVQLIGVPEPGLAVPDADAVVVALKSRTAPVAEAVAQSLAAQRWLAGQGARQYLFKYCSTFDSTDAGQYRPGRRRAAGRAGRRLHHRLPGLPRDRPDHLQGPPVRRRPAALRHPHAPPPADADDRRQPGPGAAGGRPRARSAWCRSTWCGAGPDAIRARFAELRAGGLRLRRHRRARGRGSAPAGCGLRRPGADHRRLGHRHGPARELPRAAGCCRPVAAADALPAVTGGEVVLAGSCSAATLEQIAAHGGDPPGAAARSRAAGGGLGAGRGRGLGRRSGWRDGPVLIYASAPPDEVQAAQDAARPRSCRQPGRGRAGRDRAAAWSPPARAAWSWPAARPAVPWSQALGVKGLRDRADDRSRACRPRSRSAAPPLALALKSGNFGARDFLTRAFAGMP